MDSAQSFDRWHPLDRVERRPLTCIWELTRGCNLACVHCENSCGPRSPDELTFEQLTTTAESLARLGCRHVDLTGGEPLLHPDWDTLASRLADQGMSTALITNGTLLDERALDRAIAARVKRVGISVDGMQATHDATRQRRTPGSSPWSETAEALKRALRRLPCTVITQLNRTNLGELATMHDWLAELGVKRWQLQLAVPAGRVLELDEPYVIGPPDLATIADFVEIIAVSGRAPEIDVSDTIGYYTAHEATLRGRRGGIWLGCQAGIRLVSITYDGKVRGCSALPAEFDAGDLHTERLEDIWNDAHRFCYATEFDASRLTGACARCPYGRLCRAGCTTLAYWTTGSIYENPYCLYRLETA